MAVTHPKMMQATSREEIHALYAAAVKEFEEAVGRAATTAETAVIQILIGRHAIDRLIPSSEKPN